MIENRDLNSKLVATKIIHRLGDVGSIATIADYVLTMEINPLIEKIIAVMTSFHLSFVLDHRDSPNSSIKDVSTTCQISRH